MAQEMMYLTSGTNPKTGHGTVRYQNRREWQRVRGMGGKLRS